MDKSYKYSYKIYMNGYEENLSFIISAKSEKEALIKIIIDHHGIDGLNENEKKINAENFILTKIGDEREIAKVLDRINPLGSSDFALYRIDKIIEFI